MPSKLDLIINPVSKQFLNPKSLMSCLIWIAFSLSSWTCKSVDLEILLISIIEKNLFTELVVNSFKNF